MVPINCLKSGKTGVSKWYAFTAKSWHDEKVNILYVLLWDKDIQIGNETLCLFSEESLEFLCSSPQG